jgi:chorismate synthase
VLTGLSSYFYRIEAFYLLQSVFLTSCANLTRMAMRILTAGESHGKALVGIIDGVPAGLPLSEEDLLTELRRRRLGAGRSVRQQIEEDPVEILSGVRLGQTLGSPISLLIPNQVYPQWASTMSVQENPELSEQDRKAVYVPRPGHADWVGGQKFGHKDLRNSLERASARETAMRVALGAVAKKVLAACGCHIASRVKQIGNIVDPTEVNWHFIEVSAFKELQEVLDKSPVRVLDLQVQRQMCELIETTQKNQDTLGGAFEVVALGVPVGLGSYSQFDTRLSAKLGEAFLSLNAIKAVAIGSGFEAAQTLGSAFHDPYFAENAQIVTRTNRAGGLLAGVTTGAPLLVQAQMKPLSTLMSGLASVDIRTQQPQSAHVERSDVTAVMSAGVIGEALMALVLVEALLTKFGSDSMEELKQRVFAWQEQVQKSRCM